MPNKWQRFEKGCLVRRLDTKVLFELKNLFERSILAKLAVTPETLLIINKFLRST